VMNRSEMEELRDYCWSELPWTKNRQKWGN
jgi:hypothetical protein